MFQKSRSLEALDIGINAFSDDGIKLICKVLRTPPPALSNARFDATRDRDALRTALGLRPSSAPMALAAPTEPLEFVATWFAQRAAFQPPSARGQKRARD